MLVEAPQTRWKRRSITRPPLSPENSSFSWINAMGSWDQFLRRVGRIFRCHWKTDRHCLFRGRGEERDSRSGGFQAADSTKSLSRRWSLPLSRYKRSEHRRWSVLPKQIRRKDHVRMKLWAWDKKNLPSIAHATRTAVAATLSLALTRTADSSTSSFRRFVCKLVCT